MIGWLGRRAIAKHQQYGQQVVPNARPLPITPIDAPLPQPPERGHIHRPQQAGKNLELAIYIERTCGTGLDQASILDLLKTGYTYITLTDGTQQWQKR